MEEKFETKKNNIKKKRIIIIALIVLILVIAIIAIAITTTVTSVVGDDIEELVTLQLSSDGAYQLTVVNNSISVGTQNFIIKKTNEYGDPLSGVKFNVTGLSEISYDVKYYKLDDDNSNPELLEEYSQTEIGTAVKVNEYETDDNGEIILTLYYGDYKIEEIETLYGYELNDTIYYLRVTEEGITIIDESDAEIEIDDDYSIPVKTSIIKETVNEIGTLNSVYLNDNLLGDSEDYIPTIVVDGDTIKIYVRGVLSYSICFWVNGYDENYNEINKLGYGRYDDISNYETTEESYLFSKYDYEVEYNGSNIIQVDKDLIEDLYNNINWDEIKGDPNIYTAEGGNRIYIPAGESIEDYIPKFEKYVGEDTEIFNGYREVYVNNDIYWKGKCQVYYINVEGLRNGAEVAIEIDYGNAIYGEIEFNEEYFPDYIENGDTINIVLFRQLVDVTVSQVD